MALKTTVKVGNISNLSDARYCAGMGVDLLGFNIDIESEDFISPQKYMEIKGWLEGVNYVVESNNGSQIELDSYEFNFIQITDVGKIDPLSESKHQIILKIDLEKDSVDNCYQKMKELENKVKFFQLEDSESTPTPFKNVEALINDFPTLVGFNLSPDTLNNLMNNFNLTGIALKGSQEIKPGFKDYDELADILEYLEVED